MNKRFISILICVLALILTACGGRTEEAPAEYSFQAAVLEVTDTHLLVAPAEGSRERDCSDKMVIVITDSPAWPMPQPGDLVEIVYDGMIQESYPARIPNPFYVQILKSS